MVPLCNLLWEASEQRGTVRTVKNPDLPDATGGDGTDIGAAEIDRTQSGPTFMVTNPGDHDDGTCSFRDCTLREAIHAANNADGPNAIMMDPWFLQYVNGISLNPALGTLIVTDSISITGPGARKLYVSGEGAVRVFEFISGTSSVSGLTIASGAITGASFGVPGDGGGVFNTATLTLTDCTFIGNEARGGGHTTAGGSGGSGNGGAVGNDGTLLLERCSFFQNRAFGGNGANNTAVFGRGGAGGTGNGGAVFNYSGATLTVNNCTFAGNSGNGGTGGNGPAFAGGSGYGGVINCSRRTPESLSKRC